MNSRTFALLATATLVVASCRRAPPPPEPVIVGEIIDNFGHPVQGAVITIRDSAFRAMTNARGEFTIPFAPGSFQVRIEADHCAPFARDLQVTQPVRYPLGTKMLFRIPDDPPSAALVATTEGYRPLDRETLARTRTRGWSGGSMQNCLEYRLQDAVPTLRAKDLTAIFPLGGFLLTRVEGGLVARDTAPDSIANCSGPAAPVRVESVNLGDRQFLAAHTPPSGVYCFIPSQRYNPLFNTTGDTQAWCFEWQQDPAVHWGAVRTLPAPSGQSETDDHSPNAGGPPVNCPLRNGVIPCTEECYRADTRWPDPGDPAAFFASERESGECYGP